VTRRNVLVVLLEDGFESPLRQAIAERGNGAPKVHVVAPASVGPLEWLATDEDAARAEASIRGLEAEWSLAEDADVGSGPGEADPVQATEDALRSFSADEILLVGGAAEDGGLEAALRRFGLPVVWIRGSEPVRPRNRLRDAVRGLTSGRSRMTPFVAFVAANLALLVLSALISLVVLLLLWLL
jgi:hypothetical protein